MRFLADMGVDVRLVHWLSDNGHDAVHLRDEGLHRMTDHDVFEKAGAEDRIILTFDLDFGEIAALSGSGEVSVILFRLHDTRTANVLGRLRTVLREAEMTLAGSAVVLVEESRYRVRNLPVGRSEG